MNRCGNSDKEYALEYGDGGVGVGVMLNMMMR